MTQADDTKAVVNKETRGKGASNARGPRGEQILHESERRTVWNVLVPPAVARRVGPAWLIVRYGNGLAERIAFLQALHVTKIALPHG